MGDSELMPCPCPFCLQPPIERDVHHSDETGERYGYYEITCERHKTDDAELVVLVHTDSREAAIAAWNRRGGREMSEVPAGEARFGHAWTMLAFVIESLHDIAHTLHRPVTERIEREGLQRRIRGNAEVLTKLRAADVAEGGGWLPIDSAPKDGTHVLLVEEAPDREVVIGYWDENTDWRHVPGEWPVTPVCWQPLPSPPAPSQEGGAEGEGEECLSDRVPISDEQ